MVISGGGNVPDGFGRGANTRKIFSADSMVARYADVIGRRSTTDNAIMLAAILIDMGAPCLLVAAPNAAFEDVELGPIPIYTPEVVAKAYHDGKVVLIAGGIGLGGRTTDAAVVSYALWQAKADPNVQSIALKATKFNGVFDDDPAAHPGARRYTGLSADFMLKDYDRFGAVDRICLETLKEAGDEDIDVRLQVYAAEHSVVQALEDEHLGTTIFSKQCAPAFAQEPAYSR
jgi:uridylate kinase